MYKSEKNILYKTMKTFEEECQELVEWCKKALEEAEKTVPNLPSIIGRDDRTQYIINLVWHEWNRRLVALKIKYKIELLENEKKWIRR